MKGVDDTMDKTINDFISYLQLEKDASKHTIESYRRDLLDFLSTVNKPIEKITEDDIRKYLHKLNNMQYKKSTIYRKLCALKTFFNYLVKVKKLIPKSPANEVKINVKEKRLPKYLEQEDVRKLIDEAKKRNIKTRLIVELLYGLGARVSEIVKLKVEDIDFENQFVSIVGKGNKERHNPIHKECLDLLRVYLEMSGIKSGYIFPQKDNPDKHMNRESVTTLIKRLAKSAGIEYNVNSHALRHSYATHLLEHGCDISVVQELLGHENINTTKIYAKVTMKNKKDSFSKYHPLSM